MADARRAFLAAALCAAGVWVVVPPRALGAEKSGSPAGPPAEAAPSTVGEKAPAAPTAPRKQVEEPVFRLPELVIIGENRARIMAQKGPLAGSPLQGLHEAPLLEKEESSVTSLRRREPARIVEPTRTGTGVAAKLEGGTDGWVGGGLWVGRQTDHSSISFALDASTLKGEPAGPVGGHAGGFGVGGAVVGDWTGTSPAWLAALSMGATPDLVHAGIGWREEWRDLPWYAARSGSMRRLTRIWAAGDESRVVTGGVAEQRIELTHLRAPVGSAGAFRAANSSTFHVWERDSYAVRLVGRATGELAEISGDHLGIGGTIEASWVPAGPVRARAGLRVEGVFGSGVFAGSMRPVAGVAWTMPRGPEAYAEFSPVLDAPWATRDAVESPYSAFVSRLRPVRELARIEAGLRLDTWRGDEGRVGWRYTSSKDARSWAEMPAAELYAPVPLPALRVGEFFAGRKLVPVHNLSLLGELRLRSISSDGGDMTNLPHGEGTAGVEYAWRTVTAGIGLEAVGSRPRSIDPAAGKLKSFAILGAKVAWRPRPLTELWLRVENLNGADVERWGGYPEPRHFLAVGALAAF